LDLDHDLESIVRTVLASSTNVAIDGSNRYTAVPVTP